MLEFKEAYNLYSATLDKEDLLINNRINWLLGSQSLLLAVISYEIESDIGPERIVFLTAVAMVGGIVSSIIWLSIIAAIISFRKCLLKLRKLGESVSDFENYPQLDRRNSTLVLGFIAPFLLPLIFVTAWIYLLDMILKHGNTIIIPMK